MSPTISLKALPLHRLLALAGATLLFVALFLPWTSLSFNDEFEELMGVSAGESISGWDGVGRLAGIAAILLLTWELARLIKRREGTRRHADLVTLSISGIAAVLAVVQFLRAVTNSESGELGAAAPGVGAYLILISGLVLTCAVGVGVRNLGIFTISDQRAHDVAGASSLPPPPPPPASTPSDPAGPDGDPEEAEEK